MMWDSPNLQHLMHAGNDPQISVTKRDQVFEVFCLEMFGSIPNNPVQGNSNIDTSLDEYLKNESKSKIYILPFFEVGHGWTRMHNPS